MDSRGRGEGVRTPDIRTPHVRCSTAMLSLKPSNPQTLLLTKHLLREIKLRFVIVDCAGYIYNQLFSRRLYFCHIPFSYIQNYVD